MNRISSGEQLEAMAEVMDEQEKKKIESEKTSDTAKPAETVADSSSSSPKDTSVSDLSGASKPRNPLHKSDSGGSSSLSFVLPHQHPDRRRGGLVGLNASQTDVPLSAGFAQPLLMFFHIFQVMLPLIRGNPALLTGLF